MARGATCRPAPAVLGRILGAAAPRIRCPFHPVVAQYPKGNYPGWCIDALAAVGVHLPKPPGSLRPPLFRSPRLWRAVAADATGGCTACRVGTDQA